MFIHELQIVLYFYKEQQWFCDWKNLKKKPAVEFLNCRNNIF